MIFSILLNCFPGRADDNEETIKKRLATFHKHSEPVIDAYKSKCAAVRAVFTNVTNYVSHISEWPWCSEGHWCSEGRSYSEWC